MSKQRTNPPVEVQQPGSFLSTQAEQAESSSQLPLPAHIEKVCPLCGGTELTYDGEVEIVCPACQPHQPLETTAMALAATQVSAGGSNGQSTTPAPACSNGPVGAFNAAEEQCPNCLGKKYFTEQVLDDEGKKITATIACARCNGLGRIFIPLFSPVYAQEKAMAPTWPTEKLELNWPWVDEPDPMIGTVVGWNWVTEEVAVITKQPKYMNMKPWKVIIELQPMPKNLLSCIVIGIDEPVVHKDVDWYTTWTRAGEESVDPDTTASFFGKCVVQTLA